MAVAWAGFRPYRPTMGVSPAQLADLLVGRARVERERFEARATRLRELVEAWATRARSEGLIHRAWLIGTLAWGEFGAASDVDLVVEGLAPDQEGRIWAELVSELCCEVDLLSIESLPESFRRRVLEQGVELA
ncbi:MAG: nucleotidyltransferase domain-containing protein [Myxococcales bacterium]|nr:nucleotidyltransferase domain-containing protein [Myxococcales bacterium]